jgi:hypothetical protein
MLKRGRMDILMAMTITTTIIMMVTIKRFFVAWKSTAPLQTAAAL